MNNVIKFRETFRETFSCKSKKIALICAFFALNLGIYGQSCAQKKGKILVKSVEVLVDNINEEGISSQIFELAKNSLNGSKVFEKAFFDGEAQNYSIKINMRERSFYKNIDSVHSLYASYQLFSESGACVLENVFCSESKKSILSTLVQQKQVAKIAKDLKKFFESGIKDDA